LENIMTRASVLNPAATLTDDDLHRWLSLDLPPADGSQASEVPVGMRLEEMERKLIEATLEHFGGHRAKTAEALGIGIRTLSGKLREYGYAPREKSFSKAG
jgi:DNA-binding NtrC family response regulator